MSPTLVDLPLEPDASGVQEVLQLACDLAEQGAISMIAITIIERDGRPRFARSKVHNRTLLTGALARHQFRIMLQGAENQ